MSLTPRVVAKLSQPSRHSLLRRFTLSQYVAYVQSFSKSSRADVSAEEQKHGH